jgi:hypothetical protein
LDGFAEASDEEEDGLGEEFLGYTDLLRCRLKRGNGEAMELERKRREDAAAIERLNAASAEGEERFLMRGVASRSECQGAWTLRRWMGN